MATGDQVAGQKKVYRPSVADVDRGPLKKALAPKRAASAFSNDQASGTCTDLPSDRNTAISLPLTSTR
jgi:hypothetical protein